jgi:hypothetical protein
MVATQILNKRPEPPGPEVREQRLRPEVVAATIVLARSLPERACGGTDGDARRTASAKKDLMGEAETWMSVDDLVAKGIQGW